MEILLKHEHYLVNRYSPSINVQYRIKYINNGAVKNEKSYLATILVAINKRCNIHNYTCVYYIELKRVKQIFDNPHSY